MSNFSPILTCYSNQSHAGILFSSFFFNTPPRQRPGWLLTNEGDFYKLDLKWLSSLLAAPIYLQNL